MEANEIWRLYQSGIDFKNSINLYETVRKNERFFAGDQWAGVNAPDLPKPVLNFIKRACQQKIAEVKSNPTRILFSPCDLPSHEAPENGSNDLNDRDIASDRETELLNALFQSDWDRLKMDAVNLDGLQDACISGDYILYSFWDAQAETGQLSKGRVAVETIDNVNFYPGNPNDREIQRQPYIILARRELRRNVINEALRNGLKAQAEMIFSDSETDYQSGDMARSELRDEDCEKCITLLYLYRDDKTGHVMAQKTTRDALVKPEWDTKLTRYPVAMMNWENRKNCCHGRAEITGLIPAQRYINQMYAMTMLFTMQSACPKPVFNQGMIKAWSTAVGTAIPVNGDVNAAAKYLAPPDLPEDTYGLPEKLMRTTLEMAGVSDVMLGNVNPVNSSALKLARDSSTLIYETVKTRFYSMMEDFARNWLDMICAYQTVPRWERVGTAGRRKAVLFDGGKIRKRLFSVEVEVGAATSWSEALSVQTLNRLFDSGALTPKQYIERLPDGYLPMKSSLIREFEQREGEVWPDGRTGNRTGNGKRKRQPGRDEQK